MKDREEIMRMVNEEFPFGVELTEETLNERPMTGEEGFRLSREEFGERAIRSKDLKPKRDLFNQLMSEELGTLSRKKFISIEEHEDALKRLRIEVEQEMRIEFERRRSQSHSRGGGFNRKSSETDNTITELNDITQQANNNTVLASIIATDIMN